MEKYKEEIMTYLRYRRGLSWNDESQDKEIMEMDKRDVFNEYLGWIGICGYSEEFIGVIENLYGLELESQRAKLITKGE